MKLRSFLLFFYPFLLVTGVVTAQNKLIQVNFSTGSANVAIPLYTINSGGASMPMSLIYSATGIRANDVEGSAGVGWNLKVGGAVTRELRGLPDDCTQDILGNSKAGWMTTGNSAATAINSFNITNTNAGTCTDEANDINYINTYFASGVDTEPDIFNVQAPGLSCQLVYDKLNNQFRTIPYQDLKITYNTGTNGIISFVITNDKGITYTFATVELSFKRTISPNNANPQYFAVDYGQFRGTLTSTLGTITYVGVFDANGNLNWVPEVTPGSASVTYSGGISYAGAWNLTSIADNYGNNITLSYIAGPKKGSVSPVSVFVGAATAPTLLYSVTNSTTPNLISLISYGSAGSSNNAFTFNWQINKITQKAFISSITGFGRNFQFNYNSVAFSGNNNNFNRYFLNNVIDPACGTPFNYAFTYINPSMLPDSTSADIDYWGYFNKRDVNSSGRVNSSLKPDIKINPGNVSYETYKNPQTIVYPTGAAPAPSASYGTIYPYEITGNNRQPAPFDGVTAYFANAIGSLNRIYYATGGYTSLSYEPNDYYDSLLGGTVLAGGIRVTQIDDNELIQAGTDPVVSNTTYYSYADPLTGHSSGKPVSLPVFAFTTPYTGTAQGSDKWIASTISSYSDLSPEDHSILYSSVIESMPGTGTIVHQFTVPATYGAAPITAPSLPWQPTPVYVGRATVNGTCPSIGLLTNSANTYPFAPNPNYDFERALPTKTITYNTVGDIQTANEISETDYTYSTPAPNIITAFKFDYNNQTSTDKNYGYSKYNIYTSAGPLITQIYNKIYDLGSTSSAKQTATNYFYNSSQHKLPTQISVTNSDGSTITTNTKYVKDYTLQTSAPGDNITAGIQYLQNSNINVPIEKYNQYTPAGTGKTTVTTSAQLTEFGMFTFVNSTSSFAMPMQALGFSVANGIPGFQPSSVSGSNTFSSDPTYRPSANFLAYDYAGGLLSKDNGYGHVQTTILNHNNASPAATFDNAKYDQIAISDFDTYSPGTNFILNTSTSAVAEALTTPPGHAGVGSGVGPGVTFVKTLNKSPLSNYYIFSIWLNAASSGTINVALTGTGSSASNTATISYSATTVPNTATGWQYYEKKIPLTGITSTSFTITVTPNQSVSVDDILFYPDAAEVKTYGYDAITNFKIAETSTNGVSAYFNMDQYGRLRYAYDQDKNIVSRIVYASTGNIENMIGGTGNGAFLIPLTFTNIVNSRTVTFSNTSFATPCMPGPQVSWDFGDSSTTTSASGTPVQHTYTAIGTYTVTMSFVGGTALPVTNKITVQ